jgi:hypothetical protein
MMRIAAGICTYASSALLKRCLESLRGLIDLRIVIYGRYLGFPSIEDNHHIAFDTRLLLLKWGFDKNTILVDISPYDNTDPNLDLITLQTQMDHRNKYLEICKEMGIDWLLVIDDDDYVIRSRSDFSNSLCVHD